mmetsp:Transcript_9720/g.27293  ORF Transcript_9720/g.27293 Transcript_9720/m.27293 type:complete len:218 (+) Transcript_9720:863-1516(+)
MGSFANSTWLRAPGPSSEYGETMGLHRAYLVCVEVPSHSYERTGSSDSSRSGHLAPEEAFPASSFPPSGWPPLSSPSTSILLAPSSPAASPSPSSFSSPSSPSSSGSGTSSQATFSEKLRKGIRKHRRKPRSFSAMSPPMLLEMARARVVQTSRCTLREPQARLMSLAPPAPGSALGPPLSPARSCCSDSSLRFVLTSRISPTMLLALSFFLSICLK